MSPRAIRAVPDTDTTAEMQHHPPRPSRLLTADEVASLLQVTRSWVYAETRAHRIPHVPLGRYIRYREDAIYAWIEQLEDDPDAHSDRRHRRSSLV
jgi:excisionase family DNA binding protein